jgi:hypothetical protein
MIVGHRRSYTVLMTHDHARGCLLARRPGSSARMQLLASREPAGQRLTEGSGPKRGTGSGLSQPG